MGRKSRKDLKDRFNNEAFRNSAFRDLVDSTFNINDDKIGITNDYGLTISAQGGSPRLLSFYEKYSDTSEPLWSVSLQSKSKKTRGLNFLERDESRLFIQSGGNVGIATEQPNYNLDVNGMIAAAGYIGTYAWGNECTADGKWQTISSLRGLKGCQCFEIFAHINDKEDDRFGLTHATILISSGRNGFRHKIHTTEASSNWIWGKFLNKIKFRWQREEDKGHGEPTFEIQMKSRSHYGAKDGKLKHIFYRVTKKWDVDYELDYHPQPTNPSFKNKPAINTVNNNNNGSIRIGGKRKIKIK